LRQHRKVLLEQLPSKTRHTVSLHPHRGRAKPTPNLQHGSVSHWMPVRCVPLAFPLTSASKWRLLATNAGLHFYSSRQLRADPSVGLRAGLRLEVEAWGPVEDC